MNKSLLWIKQVLQNCGLTFFPPHLPVAKGEENTSRFHSDPLTHRTAQKSPCWRICRTEPLAIVQRVTLRWRWEATTPPRTDF